MISSLGTKGYKHLSAPTAFLVIFWILPHLWIPFGPILSLRLLLFCLYLLHPGTLRPRTAGGPRTTFVQHILVSRLGSIPRGLLPSSTTVTRTALSIYQTLTQYYSTCNFADCTESLHSLQNSTCTAGHVSDYVSRWQIGLVKLQSAHFAFNVKICISLFICGLPSILAFNTLRADLPRRIAAIDDINDYGAFLGMTEAVLELDTIFCPSGQPHAPCLPRAPPPSSSLPPAPITTASPTALPDSSSRVSKKDQVCNNCKLRGLHATGHIDATCFQPGGGMEGRREEYMNNKGRIHAMFADCLENTFSLPDPDIPLDSFSISSSLVLSSTPDNEPLLPPLANLCVTSFDTNSEVR